MLSANWSIGRMEDAGDFVCINPVKWRVVSRMEAKYQRIRDYGKDVPFQKLATLTSEEGGMSCPEPFRAALLLVQKHL